jgi:hypothetical protein
LKAENTILGTKKENGLNFCERDFWLQETHTVMCKLKISSVCTTQQNNSECRKVDHVELGKAERKYIITKHMQQNAQYL